MAETTMEQIRNSGLEALKRELGMVRFTQQFSNGEGDYSVDRHQWLDKLSREEVRVEINALQQRSAE